MESNIADVARLIGEPAHARMLTALMSGKSLTATELFLEADITAQTASSRLTDKGRHFLSDLGAYFDTMKHSSRPLCKSCLDWSERRNHLAGSLGQWILDDLINRGWLRRLPNSRVVRTTKAGRNALVKRYGLADTRLVDDSPGPTRMA